MASLEKVSTKLNIGISKKQFLTFDLVEYFSYKLLHLFILRKDKINFHECSTPKLLLNDISVTDLIGIHVYKHAIGNFQSKVHINGYYTPGRSLLNLFCLKSNVYYMYYSIINYYTLIPNTYPFNYEP